MSVLRSTYMTNVRNAMDATNSARWSDAEVRTALGVVGAKEWSGILAANPYYRFAQRSITTSAAGVFTYASLNSGSGDTAQTFYRLFTITDGQSIYQQIAFMDAPLGTTTSSPAQLLTGPQWYDAGDNVQILPASALTLTVSINWTPTTIDALAADGSTVDFPLNHEAVVYLGAAAFLLDKAGAESDAAGVMRASANEYRSMMFQDLARRSARPIALGFNDAASNWGSRV